MDRCRIRLYIHHPLTHALLGPLCLAGSTEPQCTHPQCGPGAGARCAVQRARLRACNQNMLSTSSSPRVYCMVPYTIKFQHSHGIPQSCWVSRWAKQATPQSHVPDRTACQTGPLNPGSDPFLIFPPFLAQLHESRRRKTDRQYALNLPLPILRRTVRLQTPAPQPQSSALQKNTGLEAASLLCQIVKVVQAVWVCMGVGGFSWKAAGSIS